MHTKVRTWHLGLALLVALTLYNIHSSEGSDRRIRATANIRSCAGDATIRGFATLSERPSDEGVKLVDIFMVVHGLPDGEHAWHIHETAACSPSCGDAGGHFDPGPNSNSSPDGNHPFHAGDLVNIDVHRGLGVIRTTTSRISLSPGPLSLFEADGTASSAFIIHVNPDTYCPDGPTAGCAGGARAACGVIELR